MLRLRLHSLLRHSALAAAVIGACVVGEQAASANTVSPGESAPIPGIPKAGNSALETPRAQASKGLALDAAKVLTCADASGGYLNRGRVLVQDGRILAVGAQADLEIPAGFEHRNFGDLWLMPGMIDLHSHIGGTFDINGAVYQANPGLRVSTAVIPGNAAFRRALAAGVTTVLFIPGSATTVGGQGVLLKTAPKTYDAALVRDPGSLKIAQADNPKRWGYGMNRIMLNWQIRETLRRGKAHVRLERERAAAAGEEPSFDPQWEIFAALMDREAQISTHTQVAQVVAASIRIMVLEAGLPMFIDHGSMDGYRVAGMAKDAGVQAILGPRNFSSRNIGRDIDHDGKIVGFAAEYQRIGHPAIGFNTDAPVIPGEELALQAGIACRFGFMDNELQTVRGLTRVPAETVGLGDRIGALRAGLDADIVVISGHPGDPRSSVEAVYVDGELSYDTLSEWRVF